MSSSDYEKEDHSASNKQKFVESNDYVIFGTPIELNEDELESGKKPIKIEQQVATDEKGRRRFHGAFTGGFSAGFFNTCGSQQGWAPSTFVSSRSDRNISSLHKPENYMDEEDFSEFGIAPKKYSTKSKYNHEGTSIKNEIDQSMESHQVLRSILPDKELYNSLNIVKKTTIGFDLMRKMGWKEGRGFGENISVEKTSSIKLSKVYGCELPSNLKKNQPKQSIWISPKDDLIKIPNSKSNFFGIGYITLRIEASSLSDSKTLSKRSFKPTGMEKKGIQGTAYGIGVFDEHEDEDDNIYDNDTIEHYDFSLEPSAKESEIEPDYSNKRRWQGFIKPKEKTEFFSKQYNLPIIPDSFTPDPILDRDVTDTYQYGSRKAFDRETRSRIINDEISPIEKAKIIDNIVNKNVEHRQLSDDLKKRFVSSGHTSSNIVDTATQDKILAANSGMFGKLTRKVDIWLPSDILCRRFNIICVGLKNNNQSHINCRPEKKATLFDIAPTFLTPLPNKSQGPLSILNSDYTLAIQKPVKDNKFPGDEIKNDKKIEENKNIISSYDNITKPSIDLFKAVFGNDIYVNVDKIIMDVTHSYNSFTSNEDEHLYTEWKDIQKTTFTNWCNTILACHNVVIQDLYKDFCDGVLLIKLYETISGKKIDKIIKIPKIFTHKLENISLVMKEMNNDGVKFVNIDPLDIGNGNPKLILALIWHMILYYHIGIFQSINENASCNSSYTKSTLKQQNKSSSDSIEKKDVLTVHSITPKILLLKLINSLLPELRISNLTTDWNSGKLLAALVEKLSPGSCSSYQSWNEKNSLLNVTTALCLAEVHLGIPVLIEPHHMAAKNIDELSMITYLSSFIRDGGVVEKYFVTTLIEKFPSLNCIISNMTSDWNNGIALCKLVQACNQNALLNGYFIDFKTIENNNEEFKRKSISNIKYAMSEANKLLNIESKITPELFVSKNVPALAIMSYVSFFITYKMQQKSIEISDICKAKDLSLKLLSIEDDFYVENNIKLIITSKIMNITQKDFSIDIKFYNSSKSYSKSLEAKISFHKNECYVEFIPLEIGNYQINVLNQDKHISGSPMYLNIFGSILQSYDVELGNLNQNIFNIDDFITFIIYLKKPVCELNCVFEEMTTKTKKEFELVKMSEKSYRFSTKLHHPGKYNFIINSNDDKKTEILKKSIECIDNIEDSIKILSPKVIYVPQKEVINFKVDTTNINKKGELNIKLKPYAEKEILSFNDKVEVNLLEKNGLWDIAIKISEIKVFSWIVNIYWDNYMIPNKFIIINTFDPNKIKLSDLSQLYYEILSQTGKIGDKIDVKITIPITAGIGDLFYAMEGPEGQMKVLVEPVYRDEHKEVYLLSSIPNKIGDYKLILNFGGLEIPGFPKNFTIIDNNLIDITQVKIDPKTPKIALYNHENKFTVHVGNKAGKGQLNGYYTFEESENNRKYPIHFTLEDDKNDTKKYIGSFRVFEKKNIIMRLFYGEEELTESSIHFSILDISKIDSDFNITTLNNIIVIDQRYIFYLFLPFEEIDDCLWGSIIPPNGKMIFPGIKKYFGEYDNFKKWLGKSGRIYQMEFIPTEEGKYVVNFSFLHHPISGFPKVFKAEKATIKDENNVIINIPQNGEFKIGDLSTIVVDARNVDPGTLKVAIFDPESNQISVDIVQIYWKKESTNKTMSTNHNMFQLNFNMEKPGTHKLSILWNGKKIKGCPFILKAITSLPETCLRSNIVSNAYVNETIKIMIDNIGDLINNLDCMCFDSFHKPIKTVLEPNENEKDSYVLNIIPESPGMHQVEISFFGEQVKGSPFNFNVSYPINAKNVKVYGPGLISGLIDEDKGIIYVQTDQAGSGLLQVAIQGPKNGFKLSVNYNEEEEFEGCPTVTINYQPYMSGLYVINILWSGEHVSSSPFQVYNCNDQNELEEIYCGKIPANYLTVSRSCFQDSFIC
ncbi:hypothetical protein HZS_6255 [Henneguya salminicola]|nr:hypothetical protein HZS_6255 [Henneguya salminicola]